MAKEPSTKNSQSRRSSQTATSAKKAPAKTKAVTAEDKKREAIKKAAPKPIRKKKPTNRPKKIDWAEAFIWYCDDMTRTYQDVADRFKVAKQTVERNSAKEAEVYGMTWLERRQRVGEKLEIRARKQRYKDGAARDEAHLRIARNAQALAGNAMQEAAKDAKNIDWRQLGKAVETGLKAVHLERTILGLPVIIAQSETMLDEADDTPPAETTLTAKALEARIKRIEELRNNG